MKAGMTGHQSLGSKLAVEWLQEQLMQAAAENEVTLGYTCLAAGADQLFASTLYQLGIPYVVLIPSKQYEDTFDDSDILMQYRLWLSRATKIVELGFDFPTETAFFEAGKKIVDCSDLIVAVWNGKPAKGLGGTGDVVKYALSRGKPLVHLNPVTLTVAQI